MPADHLLKEGYKSINDWTETVLKNAYSQEDENFIINSKRTGVADKINLLNFQSKL